MAPAMRCVKWRPMCRGTYKTLLDTPTGSAATRPAIFSRVRSCDRMQGRASRPQGPRNHHAARLDRYRLRARLYRPLVRGGKLWGPDPPVRARRRLATLHLSRLASDLLHLLDILWLGGARVAHRLRLLDHLYRPDPVCRTVLAADHAHRAAGPCTEHHVDCRLHCR